LNESYEEIQCINEELTASNEEIRCINEELTASNEEIRCINEELTGHNEEIERINKELDNYAHVISHDLKGPLTSIIGFTEVLNGKYANLLDEDGQHILRG